MAKRRFQFDLGGGRDLTSLTAPNFDPVGPLRGILEAEEDRLTDELGRSAVLPQPSFPTPHPAAIGLAGLGDALVTLGQPRIGGRAHSAFSQRLAELNQRRNVFQNRQQQQAFQQQEEVRQRAAQADLESTRAKLAFERDKEVAVIQAKVAAEAQGRQFEQRTTEQVTGIEADVEAQERGAEIAAASQGRTFGHDLLTQGIDIAARDTLQGSDQEHQEAMQNLAFGQQVDLTQMNFAEARLAQQASFANDLSVMTRQFEEAREVAKTAVNSEAALSLLDHKMNLAKQEIEHNNSMKMQALDFLGRGQLQQQAISADVSAARLGRQHDVTLAGIDLASRRLLQKEQIAGEGKLQQQADLRSFKQIATEAGVALTPAQIKGLDDGTADEAMQSAIQNDMVRNLAERRLEKDPGTLAREAENFTKASFGVTELAQGFKDEDTGEVSEPWNIQMSQALAKKQDINKLKAKIFKAAEVEVAGFREASGEGGKAALRAHMEALWRQETQLLFNRQATPSGFGAGIGRFLRNTTAPPLGFPTWNSFRDAVIQAAGFTQSLGPATEPEQVEP